MMNRHCGCFCHGFAMVANLLGCLAALLFFIAGLKSTMVWGHDALFYFEAVVVLYIAARGTKSCKCCWGHGMGGCGACAGMNGKMEGKMDGGMCRHEKGCTCGNCDRCK